VKKSKPMGQAKPLTVEQVKMITTMLKSSGEVRDLALFRVAIDSMLRLSDILKLRVRDVISESGVVVSEFTIRQRKTKEPVSCGFCGATQEAVRNHIDGLGIDDPLFSVCARQFQRLVKKWVRMLHIDPDRYSPHSLRRTKASIIYARTNNVEAVRQLLGHTSVSATSAYLGIDRAKALEISREIEI
jgi:integrase